jgi:hypothetical protein
VPILRGAHGTTGMTIYRSIGGSTSMYTLKLPDLYPDD